MGIHTDITIKLEFENLNETQSLLKVTKSFYG